jgi:hypothetical protein
MRPLLSSLDKLRRFGVIGHVGDGAISNVLNRLVNHLEWHQKPLFRLDQLPETVCDGQIDLHCAKQAVEDIFKPGAVQVVRW